MNVQRVRYITIFFFSFKYVIDGCKNYLHEFLDFFGVNFKRINIGPRDKSTISTIIFRGIERKILKIGVGHFLWRSIIYLNEKKI